MSYLGYTEEIKIKASVMINSILNDWMKIPIELMNLKVLVSSSIYKRKEP